jgi:hypothetical protein
MLNHHLTAELARHRHAQLLAEADRERLARATRHHATRSTRRAQRVAVAATGWLLAVAAFAALLVLKTASRYFP